MIVITSVVCASIIAWFVALLKLFPFTPVLLLIASNNVIPGIVLGPILLIALYPRVKRFGLLIEAGGFGGGVTVGSP